MKLFAFIFVTAISTIATAQEGSPDETSTTTTSTTTTTRDQIKFPCPHGYRLDFDKCIEIIMVGPVCPVEKGNSDGDRCVISSKHCPSGYYLLEDHQTCAKEDEKRLGKYGCDIDYYFDEKKGVCTKVVDLGTVEYKCDDYYTFTDNLCNGSVREPYQVCAVDSDLPKGCQPRRIEKVFDGKCDNGYKSDSTDPHSCVFNPVIGKLWCPFHFALFKDVYRCEETKTWPVLHCNYGNAHKGRCIQTETMKSKWTCSSKPDTVNRSIGKFRFPTQPILACFEGILTGGVCEITKDVQPVIGCPEGYTADSDGKECNLVNNTAKPVFECPAGYSIDSTNRVCELIVSR